MRQDVSFCCIVDYPLLLGPAVHAQVLTLTFVNRARFIGLSFLLVVLVSGCKKDPVLIDGNNPPYYEGIPDVKIENYVNRIFIDLIGREPLDAEMAIETIALKEAGLSMESRETLLLKLQEDSSYVAGDISYRHAYYQRVYDQSKARFIEAASDAEIDGYRGIIQARVTADSLNGLWDKVADGQGQIADIDNVLNSRDNYRSGLIEIADMSGYMVNNAVYDDINMNTFNFINASFDNMFFRYPTESEFLAGYNMVENNTSGQLLGMSGQNKVEYINILTSSREFYQGLVMWVYQQLMAREPNTEELVMHVNVIFLTHDLQHLQREVMKTDEYAQFD